MKTPVRKVDPRRVKIHRSYSVDEIARLLGVHKNTVRGWLRTGLQAIDDARPRLVRGEDLRTYLNGQIAARRRPCGRGEMFCFRCRIPRSPAGPALYRSKTALLGCLEGVCAVCGGRINRRASVSTLPSLISEFEIQLEPGLQHITEMPEPILNCDFEGADKK